VAEEEEAVCSVVEVVAVVEVEGVREGISAMVRRQEEGVEEEEAVAVVIRIGEGVNS